MIFCKVFVRCRCMRHCHLHRRHVSARFKHSNPWVDTKVEGTVEIPIGSKYLKINTGKLARFADGAAVAQYGDTSVMVTAVSKGSRSTSFLPLTVDYRQKAAAAGRIPTNYLRRELGPTDKEILTSRMIDRSLRPLFPLHYCNDTQLVCNMLAVDGNNDPDIISINAASAALAVSDIPWDGPIAAVRVGCLHNNIVINPTRKQMANSSLNLVMTASNKNQIVMLDASAENMDPVAFKYALENGLAEAQHIAQGIQRLQTQHGHTKRLFSPPTQETLGEEILECIRSLSSNKIREVFTNSSHHKFSRDNAIRDILEELQENLKETYRDVNPELIAEEYHKITKELFRSLIFERNLRCDGRELTDLRPITCDVDLYQPLHGSALFQRGQTQVLCTVTFDSPESAAKVDTISAIMTGVKEKNFFLHYEFPPYATNETGRGGIGRRELGHGALAEKALRPMVPSNFPFTIRLTTEVLESNGSSSMASACGGSLALMDAGVPLSAPVAGIAVGLVTKMSGPEITDYKLLTDLLGIEDYMGDMDFKLAGTEDGITALQADIKLDGLPLNIAHEAIDQAMDGTKKILAIMRTTQPHTRSTPKENGPVIEKVNIPPAKRGQFVGAGGVNLKKLMADTGVSITPMEDGNYKIFGANQAALDEAKEKIDELVTEQREPELEFGAIHKAKIVEIRPVYRSAVLKGGKNLRPFCSVERGEFGVMVTLYPNMTPALVHNSQLDQRKVHHPSALGLTVGQEINVKYFGRDPASGNMRLSRKVLTSLASSVIKNLGGQGGIGKEE